MGTPDVEPAAARLSAVSPRRDVVSFAVGAASDRAALLLRQRLRHGRLERLASSPDLARKPDDEVCASICSREWSDTRRPPDDPRPGDR